MSKQKLWRAAWPHVTVGILDEGGSRTVVAFGEGGVLPPNADPEDVKRLAVKGALVEVEAAEPDKPVEKTAATPVKEPDHEPQPVIAEPKLRAPQTNASKAEWVAYAVAMRDEGVSEANAKADAEAMSKADLITVYGNGTNGS